MFIEGIDYCFVFVFDVNLCDGFGLECWCGEQLLFEVFCDDVGWCFVVNLFVSDVLLELLEVIILMVCCEFGDFLR